MPLVNIFLVGFLLFVTYWWSQQGLFSGLMHLISVIIAGSLAFALWEPATMALMGWDGAARFAWGLALIVPFIFWLMLVRYCYDRYVGRNMHFHAYVDLGGGALFGLFAAILTSGVFLLSVSFMNVGQNFGGYQPLITESGKVTPSPGGELWVGVDNMAASFFSGLSGGSFHPFGGKSMSEYQPQLSRQAGLFRMGMDPGASVVITPGTVEVTEVVVVPTPVSGLTIPQRQVIGDGLSGSDGQAVLVMTKWTSQYPTYDSDSTVRVAPMQIRLAALNQNDPSAEVQIYPPIAGSRSIGPSVPAELYAFDNDEIFLSGVDNEDNFGWLFVLPADAKPQFLLVRHTRLMLPESPATEASQLIAVLGAGKPKATKTASKSSSGTGSGTGNIGSRSGFRTGSEGIDITVTDELPMPISKVKMPSTIHLSGEGKIKDGQGVVDRPEGGMSTKLRINQIHVPGHQRIVRVQLGANRAQSVLGMSISAAASLAQPLLWDDRDNTFAAIGWVWVRNDRSQKMWFDRITKVRSTRTLPVREMGSSDTISLYFQVPKGRTIVKYSVGQTTQVIDNLKTN
jgi:hypothetical protein